MDQRPDLVVWPEGSVSFNPHSERKTKRLAGMSPRELFETLSKSGDFDLLVGGGTLEVETENISLDSDEKQGRRGDITRRYTSYNSCYLFRREGGLSGRYDKMIPLPFGEYVPFSDTFPFLKDIITGPGDFRSGSVPTIFEGSTASGVEYTFSVPICYEAILESQMRLLSEADLFVNITNDAWFGDTACPHQHAALSAVQATQFGRPMLRIAYTGISFIVEPHGRILHQTTPYTEVTTVEELRLLRVETPYSRGGWLFPWACVVFVLGGAIAARRRGSEKAA
jgi:apolipoprotein N-acyltransferase